MTAGALKCKSNRLRHSKKGIAIPVTFLILFASMLGVISITYYFAIERVNAGSQFLKVSMAKQNMLSLDENLRSILGQPGSSRTLDFGEYGGTLNIQPSTNVLVVNITDNNEVTGTLFNSSIGQITYELPYSESADTGLFLKGDSRVIVNQTGQDLSQLYIRNGPEHAEILLCYRTAISSAVLGNESDKTINNLRIYVVNLNSSQDIANMGQIPLRISCTNVKNTVTTYDVSYQPTFLTVAANLDGVYGQVIVPISSTVYGAVINVQLVECDAKIERGVR